MRSTTKQKSRSASSSTCTTSKIGRCSLTCTSFAERCSRFSNSGSLALNEAVRGVLIRRRRGQGPTLVAVDARSAVSLHPHKLHGHSRPWRSCGRLLVMRTVKEQAAQARATGLKRFIADRPCRHGNMERRADDKGTCLACSYLRLRPLVRSLSTATSTAVERATLAAWRYSPLCAAPHYV